MLLVTKFPLQRLRLLLLPNHLLLLLVTRLGSVRAVAAAPIVPAVAPASVPTLRGKEIVSVHWAESTYVRKNSHPSSTALAPGSVPPVAASAPASVPEQIQNCIFGRNKLAAGFYGAQRQRDYHTKTNKCDRNQTFCIALVLKVELKAASPFSVSPPIPAAAPAPIPASSTSPAAAAISSTTLIRTIVPEQRLVFSISIYDKYQIVGRIVLPGVLNTELPAVVLAPIQTINRVLSIMP